MCRILTTLLALALATPASAGFIDFDNLPLYVFTCNAEAWRQFCEELNINAAQLTAGNYHGWILQYCEEQMPRVAPSPKAIMARLQQYGHEDERGFSDRCAHLKRWPSA
jgi:hypothetical protein